MNEETNKLKVQFAKLIKNPLHSRLLTKDLYEYISVRSGFIAHFDRDGFHKARFWTLADFDRTIDLMRINKDLKALLDSLDPDAIPQARFKIAQAEANLLRQQAKVKEEHANKLQKQFSWEF